MGSIAPEKAAELLGTTSRAQTSELRRQVGPAASRGLGRFDACAPQPTIAFAGLTTVPLAGALVLPRAQPRPGRQVAWTREPLHVRPDLGHDNLGNAPRSRSASALL